MKDGWVKLKVEVKIVKAPRKQQRNWHSFCLITNLIMTNIIIHGRDLRETTGRYRAVYGEPFDHRMIEVRSDISLFDIIYWKSSKSFGIAPIAGVAIRHSTVILNFYFYTYSFILLCIPLIQ